MFFISFIVKVPKPAYYTLLLAMSVKVHYCVTVHPVWCRTRRKGYLLIKKRASWLYMLKVERCLRAWKQMFWVFFSRSSTLWMKIKCAMNAVHPETATTWVMYMTWNGQICLSFDLWKWKPQMILHSDFNLNLMPAGLTHRDHQVNAMETCWTSFREVFCRLVERCACSCNNFLLPLLVRRPTWFCVAVTVCDWTTGSGAAVLD